MPRKPPKAISEYFSKLGKKGGKAACAVRWGKLSPEERKAEMAKVRAGRKPKKPCTNPTDSN
jgi:hypothetical protein